MKNEIIQVDDIQNKIYSIRGKQVMIDKDLADIYQVETRVLNQAVKRNIERFPEDFMFRLTEKEWENLLSQIAISKNDNSNLKSQNVISSPGHGGRRKLPYVFTEQGVSMLSAVLKSKVAIDVSVKIIRAFAQMRRFIENKADIFKRLSVIEQKQIATDVKQIETDNKIDKILKALEDKSIKPNQGIFFNGQIFDAYSFVSDLIRSAKKSIILIDNYIDDTVLTHFTKRKKGVSFTIFTKNISKQLKLDLEKHNKQYPPIEIKKFKNAHDRFLIIDEKEVYHFGANLKDLGKKWFAFSKMDTSSVKIMDNVKLIIENEERKLRHAL